MDIKDKFFAKKVLESLYPFLGRIEVNEYAERPDIQIIEKGIGIEVTKAWYGNNGLFHAVLENRIRDEEKLLGNADMLLSNGAMCYISDISDVINEIAKRIKIKTELASGYYSENPWMRELYLFVIIDDLLNRSDFEKIASQISNQTRKMFDKTLFTTPEYVYVYDGWDFQKRGMIGKK